MKKASQVSLFQDLSELLQTYGIKEVGITQANKLLSCSNLLLEIVNYHAKQIELNCGLDEWLKSDYVGLSSLYMASVLSGKELNHSYSSSIREYPHHPHDPADFHRCVILLNSVPEYRNRIGEMADKSEHWKVLIEHWDKLEDLLKKELPTKMAPQTYQYIKEIYSTIQKP